MTPAHIRKARKSRHWSQADLAQRAGVTVTQVSRWEQGHQEPGPDAAQRLLSVFDGLDAPTVDQRLERIERMLEQLLAR